MPVWGWLLVGVGGGLLGGVGMLYLLLLGFSYGMWRQS